MEEVSTFTVSQLKIGNIRLKIAVIFLRIAKKLNISSEFDLAIHDVKQTAKLLRTQWTKQNPRDNQFIEGPYSHSSSSKAYSIRFRAFGGSFECRERASGMPIFTAAETGWRMENPNV
ncbi:hypothetical protein HJB86_33165 [Rhizobium sp. NZLR3b]|uniref:hypothetical protein n=1 Tax=Rhizobium sp. NZLR3b TaxID=2731101 RepID=UPI001C83E973|nr:hypothetical protein [Rhizobium sp. NZLR3b]MBX5193675.1 hypothetical protein [Rhizobium sp. NZLR3b]